MATIVSPAGKTRRADRPVLPAFTRAWVCLAVCAGCGGAAEQPIIAQFFSASRLLDRTALDRVATIVFDPRTEGTVSRFTIQAVSPEQHREGIALKEVTVLASVRLPGGTTAQKTLVITLIRGLAAGGHRAADHWVVTAVREAGVRRAPVARTSPEGSSGRPP